MAFRITRLAWVLTAMAIVAGADASASTVQRFRVTAPPATAGRPIALNMRTAISDRTAAAPLPLAEQTIRFPDGLKLRLNRFPRCSREQLLDTGSCPKVTRIGSGRVEAVAPPLVPRTSGTLTLYNGQESNGHAVIYLYAAMDTGPNVLVSGELTKKPGAGYQLRFEFNNAYIPGPQSSVTKIDLHLPIRFVRRRHLGVTTTTYQAIAPSKCKRSWAFDSEFRYQRGFEPEVVKSARARVPCSDRRRTPRSRR